LNATFLAGVPTPPFFNHNPLFACGRYARRQTAGWTHNRFGSKYILIKEGFVGILFVIIFFFILKRMRYKKLIPMPVE
jgi:hypothetical protein